jgi:hypothetical protein
MTSKRAVGICIPALLTPAACTIRGPFPIHSTMNMCLFLRSDADGDLYVIRSWLSGKTLDRDFTFTGDETMTYMPARGPWFDTRKPHLVTLVRWQKGA